MAPAAPGQTPPPYGAPGAAVYGAPGQAQAPFAVGAPAPARTPSVWALTGAGARASVLHGLIGYAVGWALAFITALGVVLVAEDSLSFGAVIALPGQIVGLALLGSLHSSIASGDGDVGDSVFSGAGGSISVLFVTWLVTAVILATIGIAAARSSVRPTGRARLTAAAVTGATLAATSTVVAAVLSLTFAGTDLGDTMRFRAAGVTLVLGALVLGAAAAYVGSSTTRVAIAAAWQRVPAPIRPGLRATGTHLWMTGAFVAALVLILVPARAGWRLLAAFPLWWGTATLDGLSMVHLGGLSVHGTGSTMGLGAGMSSTVSMFSDSVSSWYFVAVIGTIAIAVLASVRLALLRPVHAIKDWSTVWTTPAALAVAGLLIALLGTVRADLTFDFSGSLFSGLDSDSGDLGGALTFGPAFTLILILAAWGAIIEVSSRLLAPAIMTALPTRLVAFLATRNADAEWAGLVPGLVVAPAVAYPAKGSVGPEGVSAFPVGPEGVSAVPVSAYGEAAVGTPVPVSAYGEPPVGTPVEAPAANQFATPAPVALPKQVNTRALLLIGGIGGGIVLLAIVAIVAVTQINSRVYGPQQQVTKYVDALVAGDASAALALADPDVPNDKRALLTDAVFGAATDRVTSYEIDKVTTHGKRATVTATLKQGGEEIRETYTLVRDGHTAVVFDKWRLTAPELGEISISTPSDVNDVTVAGVKVPVTSSYTSLSAFPGTYEVSLPELNKYYASAPVPATVTGSGFTSADVSYEPTEALTTDVTKLLDAQLDTCIAATVADPADCPNVAYVWEDLTGITWTLDKRPTYEINADSSGDISVGTDTAGKATIHATYEDTDWSTGAVTVKPYEESVSLRVYGTMRVVGDKIVADD